MTKKLFETGDVIGRYTIDEFAGINDKGEVFWWVKDENKKPVLVKEKKLRGELRRAEFTPSMITNLSSKAYEELCHEIGDDAVAEIMSTSKPKSDAPSNVEQREIASKWFSSYPQIPKTRANTKLFDDYLAELPNPSFTSKDFDLAFADLFFDLELNPKTAGIEGHGEAIRGRIAINKLSSSQIKQLQKSFPVVRPADYSKMSEDQILNDVASKTTLKEFDAWTKEVDREIGVEQPVPPLLAEARAKIWQNFWELHPRLVPSEETKTKLLDLLKAKSKFNPSDEGLSVLNQHLDSALEFLIQSGGEVEVFLEPNTRTAGKTRWTVNDVRPITPTPRFDNSPLVLTIAEINAMPSPEYAERLLNPAFRAAVDNVMHSIGR